MPKKSKEFRAIEAKAQQLDDQLADLMKTKSKADEAAKKITIQLELLAELLEYKPQDVPHFEGTMDEVEALTILQDGN